MIRIKIITIPLSRRRMFYIMFNIYIFNLFKEPLAINSMAYSLQIISIKHINIKINVYFWQPGFKKRDNWNANRTHPFIFSWSTIIGPKLFSRGIMIGNRWNKTTESQLISTTMATTKNMHTDLQISSCWEHMHE
jgi:hypothetical protein